LSASEPNQQVSESQIAMVRFVSEWEARQAPPDLKDYISATDSHNRFLLIELIKVDLEFRWQQFNFPRRILEYLDDFPILEEPEIPVDLLYEEFHLRRQNGFDVDPAEYIGLFPTANPQLRQLFDLDHAYSTTKMFNHSPQQTYQQFQPGDTVDDFELLTLLGKGAFARVPVMNHRPWLNWIMTILFACLTSDC